MRRAPGSTRRIGELAGRLLRERDELGERFRRNEIVVFEEVPDTVKLPGGVSASPIVKGIGEVAVFSFVD
jgi:hypothetical protein